MLKEFKAFLLRGNVIDLAVAVVIGAAFGAIVTAVVKDLVTPLLAIPDKHVQFANLHFTISNSKFFYGDVVNAAISFLVISATIFVLVVMPMNRIQNLRKPTATTRPCPECLSVIPMAATRCSYCTAVVTPITPGS